MPHLLYPKPSYSKEPQYIFSYTAQQNSWDALPKTKPPVQLFQAEPTAQQPDMNIFIIHTTTTHALLGGL